MTQLDFFAQYVPRQTRRPTATESERQRDRGMARAEANAGPTWGDLAFAFLVGFVVTHRTFISEDVSDASKAAGLLQPPTDRAWGAVYRRALKAGLIEQCGTGRSRRRHASICPLWKRKD